MVIQRMAIWALNCEQNCNEHIWRKWPDAYFTIHVGRKKDEIHSSVLSQDTLSQYSTDSSGVIHPDETRTITNLEILCYY
jgi:hypothetical protein